MASEDNKIISTGNIPKFKGERSSKPGDISFSVWKDKMTTYLEAISSEMCIEDDFDFSNKKPQEAKMNFDTLMEIASDNDPDNRRIRTARYTAKYCKSEYVVHI